MNLTLAIPSLNRLADEQTPELNLPALNRFLRYGKLLHRADTPSEFYSRHLWHGSLISYIKQQLNIPQNQAAALASPVWQQMGMHQVSIINGEYIQIQADEAQRLCRELNEFYAQEGWQFYPFQPHLWLLTMPSESDWNIAPVLDICGQVGDTAQADGKDALQWLSKQTEIQMWLHNHPINDKRTAEKLPAINGLWLWQDLSGLQNANTVIATDSTWADCCNGNLTDLPQNFNDWLNLQTTQNPKNSDGVIFLDDLAVTLQTGDVWAYRDILESWEMLWFEPAWQALSSGRLKKLTITTDGENGGSLTLTSKSKWAFWKAERPFKGIW